MSTKCIGNKYVFCCKITKQQQNNCPFLLCTKYTWSDFTEWKCYIADISLSYQTYQ